MNALQFFSCLVGLSASNDYIKSVKLAIYYSTDTLFLFVCR